ncbi:hypothetical protein Cob_v007805 [Colletotrichum orbiculare MAFF 240422]|uniref:Uncharacterized protein n=1 Tax=Colletotrichum orbiculare (strain 104-T / ATCC 96160 / CBS 514.97 / LARS 414 / MAFF 240422) TaxID=1213857 RepID=N4VNV7_COLOR|nr:hypothetical protein Cob_v007805 [Colletotrichum orbiculare MAFF 240422]
MAQKYRPLTDANIRRFQDSAEENKTLANCWGAESAVILSFEWTAAYKYNGWMKLPTIRLEMTHPAEKPGCEGDGKPARRTSSRTINMLERPRCMRRERWAPKPWHTKANTHETFDLYREDAIAKAQETFAELARDYATLCVVNYDVESSRRGLQTFGVRLPANAVFVDLVKVLEHQTRDEGIPECLRQYTDENIAIRNGRYDRAPTERGCLGVPYLRLLEVLGPAAESHRASLDKTLKGDIAMKRIAKRIRHGVT